MRSEKLQGIYKMINAINPNSRIVAIIFRRLGANHAKTDLSGAPSDGVFFKWLDTSEKGRNYILAPVYKDAILKGSKYYRLTS